MIDERYLPEPSSALLELVRLLGTGSYWTAVSNTLQGWAVGLLFASAIAIPLAIVMSNNEYVYRALRTIVEFLRPIPSVALIPVAILIFGVDLQSKIFLVTFASLWPLLVQTLSGLRDVDPAALTTASVYRIPRADRILRVVVPSALPYVATGLRIASTTALIVALVAELIIGAPGLGQEITLAQAANAVTLMYALIISTGLLGLGLNTLFLSLERIASPLASLPPGGDRVTATPEPPEVHSAAGLTPRDRAISRRRGRLLAAEIATPIALLIGLILWTERAGIYYYPPLLDILTAFPRMWFLDRLNSDVLPSLTRLALGFGLATIVAVPLGLLLGQSARFRATLSPVLEFLRAIPAPALIPLVVLLIGIGDTAKIVLIATVCVWPILLNAMDGAAGIEPMLHRTATVFGISSWDRQLRVVLPGALPQIFAGLRVAMASGADHGCHQRDGGEPERHRPRDPRGPANVSNVDDVVRDHPARASWVPLQFPPHHPGAPCPRLASRFPHEK